MLDIKKIRKDTKLKSTALDWSMYMRMEIGYSNDAKKRIILLQELINQDIHFVGTGIEKIKSVIKKNKKWKFTEAPPQATSMVELSESFFKMKKFVDYENFSPNYIKPARITRTKRDNLRRIIR